MSNNISGFNREEAGQLLYNMLQNYGEFKEETVKLNSEYINKVAENWYSQECYDYFNNKFKPKLDEIYADTYNSTISYLEKIQDAWSSWEQATGGDNAADTIITGAKATGDDIPKCDASSIKTQQDDGTKGINVSEIEKLNTVLNNCFDEQIETIGKMENLVKGTEFIGGNQTEELVSGFKEIKKRIASLLENAKKDIDDCVIAAIEAYLDLESKTSNKFSIDGKNVDFSRITNNSADSLDGKFWSEDNIHKDNWGDNVSGKLDYEIKENGSVLITEDGVPMGWTDKKGLIKAMSKEKGYISLESGTGSNKPSITPGQTKLQDIERRDQNPMIGTGYKVNEISDQNGKIFADLQNKTTGEKFTGTFEYNEKNGDVIYTQYEKRSGNSN